MLQTAVRCGTLRVVLRKLSLRFAYFLPAQSTAKLTCCTACVASHVESQGRL